MIRTGIHSADGIDASFSTVAYQIIHHSFPKALSSPFLSRLVGGLSQLSQVSFVRRAEAASFDRRTNQKGGCREFNLWFSL